MKHKSAAQRVRLARTQLDVAQHELEKSARSWRGRLRKHANAMTLAAGFASGIALVMLPSRWWARVGAATGAVAARAARSVLTPMLVGAALAWLRPDGRLEGQTSARSIHD